MQSEAGLGPTRTPVPGLWPHQPVLEHRSWQGPQGAAAPNPFSLREGNTGTRNLQDLPTRLLRPSSRAGSQASCEHLALGHPWASYTAMPWAWFCNTAAKTQPEEAGGPRETTHPEAQEPCFPSPQSPDVISEHFARSPAFCPGLTSRVVQELCPTGLFKDLGLSGRKGPPGPRPEPGTRMQPVLWDNMG